MNISGELFIGNERRAKAETFCGVNPASGEHLPSAFSIAQIDDVEAACALAAQAFPAFAATDANARAGFLDAIADDILALGDALIERAHQETALPIARLTGERGRTIGQLRMFAQEVRDGGWRGIRIDPALPERTPLPRSDIRMHKVPLGPVAVFGASNFPLAFSVAGGDTASALAAGCPVVVKGHPAHPGTSELVAHAIRSAVETCGMPEGVFSLLQGPSNDIGAALVADPKISAVGFTGSRGGGLALMQIAAARAVPIPVYAEMSAVNPVVLMPGAMADNAEGLAAGFVGSLTMGVGQFCTNPGLVFAIDSPALDRFIAAAAKAVEASAPGAMLTAGIHDAYTQGTAKLNAGQKVATLARGAGDVGRASAALFSISADDLAAASEVTHEVFGPSSVLVRCRDAQALAAALESLEGQLTATVHFAASDHSAVAALMPTLERKAGRLIANGWPTGVEVCHAMVHGGPYPATSDGRSTSVGTLAIDRFLRPVAWQDFPDALLPAPLKHSAQDGILHRLDGAWVL